MIRDKIKNKVGDEPREILSEGRKEGTGGKILTFDIPGVCSASLTPGGRRPINGKSGGTNAGRIGDALFIDLDHGILAVADGPERNPLASSYFLKRLRDSLDGPTNIRSELRNNSGDGFKGTITKLVQITNTLSLDTDYHNATTFSAFITNLRDDGGAASDGGAKSYIGDIDDIESAILHTGDSMIFKISPSTGEVTRLTRNNHFLIGRAPNLFQTETIIVGRGDFVLLSTDGLNDLARSRGIVTEEFLSREVIGLGPGEITERIESLAKDTKIRLDDIGIICAVPGALISRPKDESASDIIIEDAGK